MATADSPSRAPPSTRNMSDAQTQRRDINPMMPPSATPQAQRVFYTPRGEPKSTEELRVIIDQLKAAVREGRPVPSGKQHEVMWMVQQHHPDHPMLNSKQVSPPRGTLPYLLNLGQRNGQWAQHPPQASSPIMMSSSKGQPTSSGTQCPQGMTIDPALAKSSIAMPRSAMSPIQLQSTSGTPRPSTASLSSAQHLSTQSPSRPGLSRTPSTYAFKPGSPAAFVFQNDHTLFQSRPSPSRPVQAQYSPPLTPELPSVLPGAMGAMVPPQQYAAPAQNAFQTGSVPSKGMFTAPPLRPSSTQHHSAQAQFMEQIDVRISVRYE